MEGVEWGWWGWAEEWQEEQSKVLCWPHLQDLQMLQTGVGGWVQASTKKALTTGYIKSQRQPAV